jgi:hypothetical protein
MDARASDHDTENTTPRGSNAGIGSSGGRCLSVADYVMGTRPTDRAGAAGGH